MKSRKLNQREKRQSTLRNDVQNTHPGNSSCAFFNEKTTPYFPTPLFLFNGLWSIENAMFNCKMHCFYLFFRNQAGCGDCWSLFIKTYFNKIKFQLR